MDVLNLPKAELHLHIEGTFEPELIFVVGWGLSRLESRGGGPPDESAEPAGVGPAKEIDEGPKPGARPATV